MRTIPSIPRTPNDFGVFEIHWSEQQEDGSWRSKRKSTRQRTREGAEKALARFLREMKEVEESDDPTVAQVFDQYLRKHSTPRGNADIDQRIMRAPLVAFGDRRAGLIRPADVEAYIRRRSLGQYASESKFVPESRRKAGDSTIRREITALQAVLNWASKKHLIPGKPRFELPKPDEGRPREIWLDDTQEAEVRRAASQEPVETRLFVRLALAYGVRKGALMDLRAGPQIDLQSGTINFLPPGQRQSRKRRATVPLTPTLRADLLEVLAQRKPGQAIFPTDTPDKVRALFDRLGFDWLTIHGLKHTAITQMLRAGEKPEVVSAITATDIHTIFRVYRHHLVGDLASAAERRGF